MRTAAMRGRERIDDIMIAQINTTALFGIDGHIIEVEGDISNGLPGFDIVGLPDAAVKESKERIRAAIKNSGLVMPSKRITLNLAPADIKKEGAHFDLPMAVGILTASEQLKQPSADSAFLGELSLNGDLRRINGVLPMVISAYQKGIKTIFLPEENAREAAVVEGLTVYGAKSLLDIVMHHTGEKLLSRYCESNNFADFVKNEDIYDFKDVKGQLFVKRALEIAAAGGHNLFKLCLTYPAYGNAVISRSLETDTVA